MLVKVYEIGGEWPIPFDEGEKIYELIRPELAQGRPVTLDFEGVKIVTSPFLNQAVGRLLEHFTPEEVKRLLHVVNLPPEDRDKVELAIKLNHEYFTNPKIREATDRIMRAMVEEE
jgi:STAS-like domain of unknown function (DUF4325)